MLVLTRQKDERIVVVVPPSDKPTTVEILVADILGSKARIGVDCPRHVSVDRKEIYEAKMAEKASHRA